MGNYCCVNRLKQPTEPKSRKSSRSPSRTLSKKSTIGSQKSSNQSSARLKKSSSFPVKRRKPLEKSETKVMSPKSAKNTTQEDYSGSDESFIMESPIPIPEASSIDEFSESYKISESSVLAKFKSIQEESVDELDYSLDQAHKLTLKDRKNILVLLNIYQSDIPEGEEETLDGYAFVTLHESVSLHKERIMLLSSHALYFLDEHDLSKLQRRINIINISLMSVDKSFSQTILHLIKSELQGDIWISGSNMANIIKGIQTMYNQIRRRYVPIIKVPSLANLKTKFNSISQITLQGYLTDEMIRLSNVLIRDGRLGENIMFFKTTRRLIGKKAEIDCIALLTDEALYCLNTQYDIDTRLELKNIISVVLAETMDQVIIEKSNGERELWMLPSKFVTDLEKVIAGTKQRRLTVAIKNKADINDFVKGYI